MKTCSGCKKSKPLTDFGKMASAKDGLQGYCKSCKSSKYKEWAENNSERNKTRQAEWKRENRDQLAAYQREWTANNLDRAREINRRKYHKRRSLTKDTMIPGIWKLLIEAYGEACLKCGSDDILTIDHIKPIALGGDNSFENLQILCKSCNSSKGHRSCVDYRPA